MADAVGLFFAMSTQWQWVGAGLAGAFRSGLRYEVVETVARSLDVKLVPAIFTDLRLLEQSALETWSRKRG
jgi:hypothetical protein